MHADFVCWMNGRRMCESICVDYNSETMIPLAPFSLWLSNKLHAKNLFFFASQFSLLSLCDAFTTISFYYFSTGAIVCIYLSLLRCLCWAIVILYPEWGSLRKSLSRRRVKKNNGNHTKLIFYLKFQSKIGNNEWIGIEKMRAREETEIHWERQREREKKLNADTQINHSIDTLPFTYNLI